MESTTSSSASESRDTSRNKSIFKRGLSRSTSQFNGSEKISSFFQIFQKAAEMTREFNITLPSDKSWRMKNYFKLLAKQREKKIILHSMPSQESDVSSNWDPVLLAQPELKRAKFSGAFSVSSEGSIPTCHSFDISWHSLDIAKAGMILEANSSTNVTFQDEEEMRRVFTLLYDVFRYKHILNEALVEMRFFQKYPEHSKSNSLVWLLFYDLHKRRFLPREHADTVISAEAFNQIGLTAIERDLWKSKVKLAASLARNRIKNNALRLNQLLPNHLRDERLVSADDSPMTGWINTFKLSKKEVCDSIEKFGLKLQSKHETVLTKNDFRFDHLCPKLLLCHPIQRAELAQSVLVKDHTIVLQDRAFCIGPAIISKILSEVPLRGTVAQSHVNSPRTTAYLANILADNDRLDKMIAFGAGDKLLEYQTYLHDLGVNNCEIYAQKFTEIHPEAAVLENLVAIFATPPNSCTGVTDPVDLICSRGGDMYMLKALTQSEMAEDSCAFLEEQKQTLNYCMSLPQVQIVLYETHSMAPEENLEMVTKMINKMNEFAREKHEEDHRIQQEQEEAEEKANKPIGIPGMSREREKEKELQESQESAAAPKEVIVPPCDLFELVPLPDLCSHGAECLSEEGCYIARIQRKEIISLDAKYMIKIAEARGLFGNDIGAKKAATTRAPKKREDMLNLRGNSGKIKPRRIKLEIERITAPTQSSIHRTRKDESAISSFADCPRHQFHTLESVNKLDVFTPRSGSTTLRRKSRTKKCQDESVKRLSRPNRRWSTSPSDLLSEVRPSFWRYATAKSVEDLIRALRKKRRNKRSFRVEEYFLMSKQQNQQSNSNSPDEEGIPGLQINVFGQKYLYPFRTPFITNKWSASSETGRVYNDLNDNNNNSNSNNDNNSINNNNNNDNNNNNNNNSNNNNVNVVNENFEDVLVVVHNRSETRLNKNSKRVLESAKTPSKKSRLSVSSTTSDPILNVAVAEGAGSGRGNEARGPKTSCELLKQCLQNANEVFQKIDTVIEEEQRKIKNKPRVAVSTIHDLSLKKVKKVKSVAIRKEETDQMMTYVQNITKIDEVNNIVNPVRSQEKKDIVLHEKYLPGSQTTAEERKFIRLLQTKLEKLQSDYPLAHWSKKKEQLAATRLSTRK